MVTARTVVIRLLMRSSTRKARFWEKRAFSLCLSAVLRYVYDPMKEIMNEQNPFHGVPRAAQRT